MTSVLEIEGVEKRRQALTARDRQRQVEIQDIIAANGLVHGIKDSSGEWTPKKLRVIYSARCLDCKTMCDASKRSAVRVTDLHTKGPGFGSRSRTACGWIAFI